MEEAINYDERAYQAALAQDRYENEEEAPEKITAQSSRPDFVIYMFLEGLVGLPGDLLKLIPGVGTILAFPFSAIMWFWRTFSSRFKNSPVQKIITNGLISWIPLTNTVFLTTCYIEETKLGKAILSKASKVTKIAK